jgi:predicted transcriptional regulator
MSRTRTIEIDSATADELEARAARRGVSVREMVAELVTTDGVTLAADADDLAELDRQWAAIEAGATAVPHDKVARWLETWGTPAFKPWRDQ